MAGWVSLLVTGAVALFNRGLEWAGSWRQAIDWGTGTTVLVGPVAAGLACWTYARMRDSGFHHVAWSSSRGFAAWVAPLLWHWWQASVVVLASVALAGCVVILHGVPAVPTSLGIAVEAVAVLAAQVSLGAALGVMTGRTWAAPLAAVGVCLLGVTSTWGLIPGIFDTGGVTGSLAGEVFNVRVLVLSGIAAAGIAAAALWAVTSVLARRPRLMTSLIAAAIVSGSWGYLVLGSGDDRYQLASGPITMTCSGAAPRVCVAADTPRPRDDAARQLARLAPALTDLGLPLAARYVQALPGVVPPTGAGVLVLVGDEETTDRVSAASAARALASPAWCPELSSDAADEAALAARYTLARWILQRSGVDTWAAGSPAGRWAVSTASEGWVRVTYLALAACRIEELAPPSHVDVR
jgi:hypothetical protein